MRDTLLGFLGFALGLPIGFIVGWFFLVYSKHKEIKEPVITPLHEMDTTVLQDLLPDLPNWIKSPEYERLDWLNQYMEGSWPHLDKAISNTIRSMLNPMFADYIGMYQIEDIEFENLSLGTVPPSFHGVKICETNANELVTELSVKWAGNPNIVLAVKLMSIRIRFQLVDLQVFATSRVQLKPLVPNFPCFASMMVSLMEKPYVDFGLRILGGDIMSIPGLYGYVQEIVKKQIASLCQWPKFLEIPILDTSTAAVKKPVGILYVNIVKATGLLKMDVFGASDPYVELKLSGERLAVKKTSTKMRNLNPEWNEKFKLVVNDPETQFLELLVYDWDKVGKDDKLGMQFVPLKQLTAHDTQELTLDLLGNTNESHPRNQKPRGQLVVELTYNPFKYKSDSLSFVGVEDEFMTKQGCIDTELAESNEAMDKCMEKQSCTDRELAECKGSPVKNSVCTRSVDGFMRRQSCMDRISAERVSKAGLLLVTVMGAEDLEADHRINPYAEVSFRGEKKKTKAIKRNRNPIWNEEFTFMIEESPLNDKLHISVLNKRKTLHFSKKESLGYIDIPLADVMYNGRINEKYHLINSPIGVIKVDIQWQIT